jgi:hypothetical protein
MPRIQKESVQKFIAFFQSASKVFKMPIVEQFRIGKSLGSVLYRYVDYRNSMPQAENGGRTLWRNIDEDIENRWTGKGQEAADSNQGLYFSNEFLDQQQPFPELDHYMNKGADLDSLIAYFKYERGAKPQFVTARAGQLKSMFLFELKRDIRGLDLKLQTQSGQNNPLLEEILRQAKNDFAGVVPPTDDLKSLYISDDAAFCQAVGNACLTTLGEVDFFETTSVRDLKSVNSVLRATPRVPIDYLEPRGRATFLLNGDRVGEGVFTIADMIYNSTFEELNGTPSDLPTKQEFRDMLVKVSQSFATEVVSKYTQLLEGSPASDAVEQVGRQLQDVLTSVENSDFEPTKIAEVQKSIQQLVDANTTSLKANEAQALKMSAGAMGSLEEMAKSIDLAGKEIENPGESEKKVDIDISDPRSDLIDPPKK